jgi:hypothetical protein
MSNTFIGVIMLSVKTLSLIGLGLYTVFAFIIVRQESLMANVLEEHSEPVLRILAYIHLVGAIAVFFLGVVLLP